MYAILIGEHYLLDEQGKDYALFKTEAEASETALDFYDMDAEVVKL